MSIHFWKSHDLARKKGAAFGTLSPDDLDVIGKLSKRELIEIAMRFAALIEGDESVLFDGRAFARIMDEHATLSAAGIV